MMLEMVIALLFLTVACVVCTKVFSTGQRAVQTSSQTTSALLIAQNAAEQILTYGEDAEISPQQDGLQVVIEGQTENGFYSGQITVLSGDGQALVTLPFGKDVTGQ